jgi:CRP-like cAMP-binding protein
LVGENRSSAFLVLEGLCARVHLPSEERRQITAFYIPGDMPDLSSVFVAHAPTSFEALTSAVIVRLPHADLHKVMAAYPAISEAFARYVVADADITDQWVANVGGREAKSAVAHLYCEMAVRSRQVHGNEFSFQLPATQAHLGDACGLSAVHINRTLMALRRSNVLFVEKSGVHVLDWQALQADAQFDEGYLLSQGQTRLASLPAH